jgi:hypothetical protein
MSDEDITRCLMILLVVVTAVIVVQYLSIALHFYSPAGVVLVGLILVLISIVFLLSSIERRPQIEWTIAFIARIVSMNGLVMAIAVANKHDESFVIDAALAAVLWTIANRFEKGF